MAVVIGVHPGGKCSFAVSAVFWDNHLPGTVFSLKSFSSVKEVLNDIVGIIGEWGTLKALAIDAPLTWSTQTSGKRECDRQLRQCLPDWIPRSWLRPPNALYGATAVQGPALVWAIAREAKQGLLERPVFVETNSRCTLARIQPNYKTALLNYRSRKVKGPQRKLYYQQLNNALVDAGILRFEVPTPMSAEELDAVVSSIVALGYACENSGIVIRQFSGESIRPVGPQSLHIIDALP